AGQQSGAGELQKLSSCNGHGVIPGEHCDLAECISANGRAPLASEPLRSCKGVLSPPINQKESRPDRVRVGTSRRRLRTQELPTGHAEPDYRCMSASLRKRTCANHRDMSASCRYCSLIPGFGVKLSVNILAGSIVLSAVAASPPHDGV